MQTILQDVPESLLKLIEALRAKLCDPIFIQRHRTRPEDFTRERQLTFPVVMLFILQKTAKSVQRHLHEFLDALLGESVDEPVTASAWTHARAKLKHTAFIELNTQNILPTVYRPENSGLQRWRGHRLLGVDSSVLRLPKSAELMEEFTPVEVLCQLGTTGVSYPEGRMSVLYDLLNHVGLDGRLEPSSTGEVDLAIAQLGQASAGDVLVSDRGFTGYRYLASMVARGLDFVARCSTRSFSPAQDLFRMDRAGRSVVARIYAPKEQRAELRRLGLPLELTVRFISLRLSTGELEVLATSLLNETDYPTEEFLQVYSWRWQHESFYYRLKSRLDLENFSGQTAEAIRQDFHSALLLCNLETILTDPAQSVLREQSAEHQYPKVVNHAVAYHAIKHRLLDLLYSQTPAAEIVLELQRMFLAAPVTKRKDRKVPRRKASLHRSYYFQRCVRKTTF
jgi:hypothetical protein